MWESPGWESFSMGYEGSGGDAVCLSSIRACLCLLVDFQVLALVLPRGQGLAWARTLIGCVLGRRGARARALSQLYS